MIEETTLGSKELMHQKSEAFQKASIDEQNAELKLYIEHQIENLFSSLTDKEFKKLSRKFKEWHVPTLHEISMPTYSIRKYNDVFLSEEYKDSTVLFKNLFSHFANRILSMSISSIRTTSGKEGDYNGFINNTRVPKYYYVDHTFTWKETKECTIRLLGTAVFVYVKSLRKNTTTLKGLTKMVNQPIEEIRYICIKQ